MEILTSGGIITIILGVIVVFYLIISLLLPFFVYWIHNTLKRIEFLSSAQEKHLRYLAQCEEYYMDEENAKKAQARIENFKPAGRG
jgi:hypothetical protein